MEKRRIFPILSILCLFLFMLGCSQSQTGGTLSNGDDSASNEPVTITLYQQYGSYTNDEYQNLIIDPVKRKYPNITIQIITPQPNKPLSAYAAAGDFPDLVMTAHEFINDYLKLGLLTDLRPLIQKYNFDLTKFDPINLEAIKAYGKQGEIYAIPFAMTFSALYFNKDIFDKFGVPYPKDGMTWNQVIDVAKKLSISDANGTQYKTINPIDLKHFASPLSLKYVDSKNDQPTLNTDAWKKVFEMYKAITDIPGNQDQKNAVNAFLKDQNLAMLANYNGTLANLTDLGNQLNWDIVSYPNFSEAPGKGLGLETHVFMISSTSNHKDEAFKVISLLTDSEHQLEMTKAGRLTALKDPAIKKEFGANIPAFKGKNIQGALLNTPALNPPPSEYDSLVVPILNSAIQRVIDGQVDVNTALLQASDEANKAIQAAKSAQ